MMQVTKLERSQDHDGLDIVSIFESWSLHILQFYREFRMSSPKVMPRVRVNRRPFDVAAPLYFLELSLMELSQDLFMIIHQQLEASVAVPLGYNA